MSISILGSKMDRDVESSQRIRRQVINTCEENGRRQLINEHSESH
jgi:hypothetical protein